MKKYLSMLVTVVLAVSLLAGCGGSGSTGQKPAGEAQEQTAQAEETGPAEDAAQADTAQDAVQADAGTAANSDVYMVYVMDAETMAPVSGANVQFCSDVLCQMGRTDENGLASFHAEPGTYTVHFMKAPEGYESSAEEFTLDNDNREAIYLLAKEESESGSAADSDNAESAETDPVMDFPLAGFTFAVPEEFKHAKGDIRDVDFGEIGAGSGIVIGYVGYQAKTEDEAREYYKSIGVETMEDVTDEKLEQMQAFFADSPTLVLFRVMGVRGDQDLDEINKRMYGSPILACDEVGTAGDYKFYYVVLDDKEYFDGLRGTSYPQDKLDEVYSIWQEAATTSNFKDRITVKEPVSPYLTADDGAYMTFETQDLEGNPVTSEELFAGSKITVVNLWATWCSNCKGEMRELEELNKELAEKGCQIIGICDDADDDEMVEEAQKVLEEYGVTYRNVCSNDVIREQIPNVILPTTYFVDSEGNLLCDPITGAHVDQYKETIEKLLSGME